MAYRFILLAALGAITFAPAAQAQTAKPAVLASVDGLTKTVRTVCNRDLKSVRCGDAQRQLVDAVRRQNVHRTQAEISRSQIDALVASYQ